MEAKVGVFDANCRKCGQKLSFVGSLLPVGEKPPTKFHKCLSCRIFVVIPPIN